MTLLSQCWWGLVPLRRRPAVAEGRFRDSPLLHAVSKPSRTLDDGYVRPTICCVDLADHGPSHWYPGVLETSYLSVADRPEDGWQ